MRLWSAVRTLRKSAPEEGLSLRVEFAEPVVDVKTFQQELADGGKDGRLIRVELHLLPQPLRRRHQPLDSPEIRDELLGRQIVPGRESEVSFELLHDLLKF